VKTLEQWLSGSPEVRSATLPTTTWPRIVYERLCI
jgi:hypothetical protein